MEGTINPFEQRLREFPGLAFGGGDVFRHRERWAAHFRERVGPGFHGRVVLEVGCADAAFLSEVAGRHPGVGFIGLDWKYKSLYVGAGRVAAAGLRNIALLRGRAQDLLRVFAAGEVDEVWVFHPEPCAATDQRKGPLVAEPFLADVRHVLRDGDSSVSVKTDHPGYYQWMLGLFGLPEPDAFRAAREATAGDRRSPGAGPRVRTRDLMRPADVPAASETLRRLFAVAATSADFWRDPAALDHTAGRCFAGVATPYESRFVGKGRPIYYFELSKL